MSNFKKAGLISLTLIAPAFIFLFLHFFGKNHFELQYLVPSGTNSEGDTLYRNYKKDLAFLYTQDPDVKLLLGVYPIDSTYSKKALNKIIRIGDRLGENDEISIVSLSVDSNAFIKSIPSIQILDQSKTTSILSTVNILSLLENYCPDVSYNNSVSYAILIDEKGYLRGIYAFESKEEFDRIFTEIGVLNYGNS